MGSVKAMPFQKIVIASLSSRVCHCSVHHYVTHFHFPLKIKMRHGVGSVLMLGTSLTSLIFVDREGSEYRSVTTWSQAFEEHWKYFSKIGKANDVFCLGWMNKCAGRDESGVLLRVHEIGMIPCLGDVFKINVSVLKILFPFTIWVWMPQSLVGYENM